MAATSIHERSFRDEGWRIEQYFGPSSVVQRQNLSETIETLPQVTVTDRVEFHSRPPSQGAVVHPEAIMAGSIDLNTLMLCPAVAAVLGWYPDRNDIFTFRNTDGDVVARTLYWRDGGVASRETDTAIRRHGYTVLVREDRLHHLLPYLAKNYEVRTWRTILKSSTGERISQSAHRRENPPAPP